jgi:hypothetical protein
MFSLIAPKELTLFTIAMLVISGLVGIVAQPHHMSVAGSGKTEMNCRVGWTYGNFIKQTLHHRLGARPDFCRCPRRYRRAAES